jgi:hypothetical protein
MRESLMYGSVRGARGNSRPYRDKLFAAPHESAIGRFCCKSLYGRNDDRALCRGDKLRNSRFGSGPGSPRCSSPQLPAPALHADS